jgi:three-Cys-motif partner protein
VRTSFGGRWTEEKLGRLSKYLDRFLIALKNQPFKKMYFDAFAGTGSRIVVAPEERPSLALEIENLSKIASGSARRALGAALHFDRYTFVEREGSDPFCATEGRIDSRISVTRTSDGISAWRRQLGNHSILCSD